MNTTKFTIEDWMRLFDDMKRKGEILERYFNAITSFSHANPLEEYEAGWWINFRENTNLRWIKYIPEQSIEEFEIFVVMECL